MIPSRTEAPDGLTVTQTADRLTLKPTLRSNALGALSWCLLFWVPLFLVRFALAAANVHLSHGADLLLMYGGPLVWFVAFAYFALRPPIVIHRDGRIEEVGKVTGQLKGSPVVAVAAKSLFVLGSGPNPSVNRMGRRIMFTNLKEAEWVANRINAFLDLAPVAPPRL